MRRFLIRILLLLAFFGSHSLSNAHTPSGRCPQALSVNLSVVPNVTLGEDALQCNDHCASADRGQFLFIAESVEGKEEEEATEDEMEPASRKLSPRDYYVSIFYPHFFDTFLSHHSVVMPLWPDFSGAPSFKRYLLFGVFLL